LSENWVPPSRIELIISIHIALYPVYPIFRHTQIIL
jgi:hypothetical protein